MKFLIDTNRYSDFAKGEKSAVELFASADRIFVPYVVLAELHAGFSCGKISQRNEAVLSQFLANARVAVLSADLQTTRIYGELFARLRAQGTPVPTNDLWIAALAVQHALPLCTRDEHFAKFQQIPRI